MSLLADLPRRTKVMALLGLTGVFVGGLGLTMGPFIRSRAVVAARQRGVDIEVGQVRIGLAAVWLKNVELRMPLMPGVRAHVDAVRIGTGWQLSITAVEVHGAQVSLKGEPDDLQRQWAAFRGTRAANLKSGSSGRERADGVDVVWRAWPGEPAQRIWGLSYEREATRERVALDTLRVQAAGSNLEVRRLRAALTRQNAPEVRSEAPGGLRELESLEADALELSVILAVPAPSGTAARAEKRPFEPDPLRGAKLRAALAEVSALAARALPDGSAMNVAGVSLLFRRGGERLNFGPSSLRVVRMGSVVELSLAPKAEASGTPLELKATLPMGSGEVQARLRGGPVSLRSLGVRDGDFGLMEVRAATLQASGDVTLAADGSSLAFSGEGVLAKLSLRRPELSSSPLSGIQLAFRARGTTTLDGAELRFADSELSVGEVRIQGSGQLSRGAGRVSAHWSGGVPLASCQAVMDATPSGLAPLISGLRMAGTFAIQSQLDFDSERPAETRVRLNVANDCQIEHIPAELSPRRFATRFVREVKGGDKHPMELESGPGTADWVPYDAISPFMEAAVLVCEDGHFPYHRGFDFEAIQNSIRDNLNQGRFVRGASTVTMQLAKNLYLGKEKTLGRKLQEAVLTQLLEQELSKRELMELYLNVIEYGPGIYGIGPAAHYYFAKMPADLSLGQALYIASILPNPEHQHFDRTGKVSAGWTRYLQRLMHIAKKIGRVSEEQLATGLSEQVAFHVADSGGVPVARDSFPDEGNDTPSELSP